MEQVVLKPYNLPEQLQILANDLPVQERPSVSDLFNQAYQEDPLPDTIFKATREGNSLKEITVAECKEQDGQVLYSGKRYVPEGDQLQLRLMHEHHDMALAEHPGQAKTCDVLDR